MKVAAYPELLVHQDGQEKLANQDDLATRVTLDSPVCRLRKCAKIQHQNLANPARPDPPDLLALLEITVSLDPLVAMALLAKMVPWDPLAHPVPQAHPVKLVATDPEETQAVTPKATTPFPANEVPTAKPDGKDPLARPDLPVKMANLDRQAPADPPAQEVKTAKMASPATRVLPEPLANPARRACVRNIAPWTAACFSKMARGDKQKKMATTSLQQHASDIIHFPANFTPFFIAILCFSRARS